MGLRTEVLSLLAKGEFLGRGITRSAMDEMTARIKERFGLPLVICRFSPNSGHYTGMVLEQERRDDYREQGYLFARSLACLEQTLAGTGRAGIIFVDDQFATGGQAHAQLLHWAGRPRPAWPPELQGEQNIDTADLGPATRDVFDNGQVALAFIFGTAHGRERIEQAARDLGFSGLEVSFHTEIKPEGLQLSPDLKGFLQDVGYELLKRARFGADSAAPPLTEDQEAGLRADALGYGGTSSVMVTPFSAPSHTITALWCPGLYKGEPWIPLFLRRGYRKLLVLG